MKTTNETNTARKLTLDEIKALPRASVVWCAMRTVSDDGICWFSADPVLVGVAGEGGDLIGSNEAGIIYRVINDELFDRDVSIWTSEPTPEQAHGITEKEYNALDDPNDDCIKFSALATAITSRGMTLEAFSESIGIKSASFWKAITGKREFVKWEIVKIRVSLQLTDDEVMKIFFPDCQMIYATPTVNESQGQPARQIKI